MRKKLKKSRDLSQVANRVVIVEKLSNLFPFSLITSSSSLISRKHAAMVKHVCASAILNPEAMVIAEMPNFECQTAVELMFMLYIP